MFLARSISFDPKAVISHMFIPDLNAGREPPMSMRLRRLKEYSLKSLLARFLEYAKQAFSNIFNKRTWAHE